MESIMYMKWPFKDMVVGETVTFRSDEVLLDKARGAAHNYAHRMGRRFSTRTESAEGVTLLHITRVANGEREKAYEGVQEDRRRLRKVKYGYEDLEVGQYVEYEDEVSARRALGGVQNRQKELGRTFSTHRYEGLTKNTPFPFPTYILRITRTA